MCSHNHLNESCHNKILCPQCDLLVALPVLEQGTKASCPRCHTVLSAKWKYPANQPTAIAISALVMLLIACLFPYVKMSVMGIESQISLFNIAHAMFDVNYASLGWFFLLFVVAVPAFCMVAIILLCQRINLPLGLKINLARTLFQMKTWCMVEIFLAGVLVSFVKLMAYGEITLGISFVPYCFFCLLQVRAFQCLDRHWLWQQIGEVPKLEIPLQEGKSGISQNVRSCHICMAILPAERKYCPRCHTKGYVRRPNSLQNTMALLLSSLVLYIPANVLPVMITNTLGSRLDSTIMSGVILLWGDGSYPVAIVIFIASIMVPSLKIVAVGWLCFDAKGYGNRDPARMHFIYELVEWVGRWSMIDVFVIAVLSSLVQMGRLMSVSPALGVILFAAVVILTMFAAMTFDPRLTWDRCNVVSQSRIRLEKGLQGG
ncbi:membrane integrity-associated transporter subunit PqiA [Arsenophonus sp.]|uniref:membrane integrity-associated transporter subunit PqiA n=1 Tax=Arsenophonus sp. TaxID=1872640 RepID=UPI0028580E79|nr:membrane integrity-associated transporter subunit PqiA [Arsenophonus sp.]MDR5615755.1 membrane integrity-associated transporter subunit PqiA [Arsenophonus sp.]